MQAFLPRRSSSWAQTVRTQISLLTTYTRRRLGRRSRDGGVSPPSPRPTGGARGSRPLCLGSTRVEFHFRIHASPKSQLGQAPLPALRPAAPRPPPCLCSPVEADLVETLFARLVDGVEAGARVLLLAAVWVMGRIRLGAAAWGPKLGGSPQHCPPRLAVLSGSRSTLHPLAHTHAGAHRRTDSIAGHPGAAGFYTCLCALRFANTLGSMYSNTTAPTRTRSRKSTPTTQGCARSQNRTLTLSSQGGE